MENVSLKLDSSIAKQIDLALKEFNYSTKTEFIRDAIRCKLKELHAENEKKKALAVIARFRGFLKDESISDEKFHKIREEFGKELEKEYTEKYNLK